VRHVEPVGAAGARALLLGEPDVFLGHQGQLGDANFWAVDPADELRKASTGLNG
jgi:hypothetical protein